MSNIMRNIEVHGLNYVMEFDHVVAVHADGTVTDDHIPGVHAPELFHVEGAAHPHDVEGMGDWTLLHGFTGQYSYNGAVLHSSEYIGGGLERHILSNPGLYVACVVEVWEEDRYIDHEIGCEHAEIEMGAPCECMRSEEAAGWAVAYMECPPEPEGV